MNKQEEDLKNVDVNKFLLNKELIDIKKKEKDKDKEEKEITQEVKIKSIEIQDKILSQIEQKVAAQKDKITAQPMYQAEKTAFEAQQGKPISDEYFLSRFALSHIGQPDSVLTQADLL